MTSLSINLNKFALVRNARGSNQPDILDLAHECIDYGAHGITVHPRPDQRHIRYDDVKRLSQFLANKPQEFNVEGYPSPEFIALIQEISPTQVTLVPDPPDALTSSFGWDIPTHYSLLHNSCTTLQSLGCRVSLFISPDFCDFDPLISIMPDRVELYTYQFAHQFSHEFKDTPEKSVEPYTQLASKLSSYPIRINAGHDLNLDNLSFFLSHVPQVQEVSIGHALVCDAWKWGLKQTVQSYLHCLS